MLQEYYRLASQIATLCATIGENPHIRFDSKPVASQVAKVLQDKLDDMAGPGTHMGDIFSLSSIRRLIAVPAAASPAPAANRADIAQYLLLSIQLRCRMLYLASGRSSIHRHFVVLASLRCFATMSWGT